MPKHIHWSDEARADLRAIDRETALRILVAVGRFLKTGVGDVKPLKGFHPTLFRLRVGGWRVFYRESGEGLIEGVRVRKRGEAYR